MQLYISCHKGGESCTSISGSIVKYSFSKSSPPGWACCLQACSGYLYGAHSSANRRSKSSVCSSLSSSSSSSSSSSTLVHQSGPLPTMPPLQATTTADNRTMCQDPCIRARKKTSTAVPGARSLNVLGRSACSVLKTERKGAWWSKLW